MSEDLYPSERNEATILLADLQRKYGHLPDTKENLTRFAKEAEARFAEVLGLKVRIDLGNYAMAENGDLVCSPVIDVISRTSDHEFDHERMKREMQWGYYDGKPGVITEDGTWRDPKKLM
jgi:hypothetical protein